MSSSEKNDKMSIPVQNGLPENNSQILTPLPIYDQSLYSEIISDQKLLLERNQIFLVNGNPVTKSEYIGSIKGKIKKCYNLASTDDIRFSERENISGYSFIGFLVNGKKEGYGRLTKIKQNWFDYCPTYTGEWVNDYRHCEKASESDDEGLVIWEGGYVRGVREGLAYVYDPMFFSRVGLKYMVNENRIGSMMLNYRDGRPDGVYKVFHKNGKLIEKGCFTRGIKDSLVGEEFYSNGQLSFIGNYKRNKRNGFGKEFDEKGRIFYEGNLKVSTYWGEGKLFWPRCPGSLTR